MTGVLVKELKANLVRGVGGLPPMGPLVPYPLPHTNDKSQPTCELVSHVWHRCHRIGAPSSFVVVVTPVRVVVLVCVRRSKCQG